MINKKLNIIFKNNYKIIKIVYILISPIIIIKVLIFIKKQWEFKKII